MRMTHLLSDGEDVHDDASRSRAAPSVTPILEAAANAAAIETRRPP